MSRNLIKLIQASGGGGGAGQTFRNHVTGAGTGVKMTDYLLGTASWSGLPIDIPENPPFADNITYNVVATFADMGPNYPLIRVNGAGPWSQLGSVANNGSAAVNSATWNDANKTVTVPYTARGAYDPNTLKTLSSFHFYFRDYTPPDEPPDNELYQVVIRVTATGSDTPSGFTTETFQIGYGNADIAGFNPAPIISPSSTYRVNRRSHGTWATTHEWEAHHSSAYDSLKASSILSDNNTTYDVWIRYRRRIEFGGNGTWTNYGQVIWTDPRMDT
jgi:hypothetical protein